MSINVTFAQVLLRQPFQWDFVCVASQSTENKWPCGARSQLMCLQHTTSALGTQGSEQKREQEDCENQGIRKFAMRNCLLEMSEPFLFLITALLVGVRSQLIMVFMTHVLSFGSWQCLIPSPLPLKSEYLSSWLVFIRLFIFLILSCFSTLYIWSIIRYVFHK